MQNTKIQISQMNCTITYNELKRFSCKHRTLGRRWTLSRLTAWTFFLHLGWATCISRLNEPFAGVLVVLVECFRFREASQCILHRVVRQQRWKRQGHPITINVLMNKKWAPGSDPERPRAYWRHDHSSYTALDFAICLNCEKYRIQDNTSKNRMHKRCLLREKVKPLVRRVQNRHKLLVASEAAFLEAIREIP